MTIDKLITGWMLVAAVPALVACGDVGEQITANLSSNEEDSEKSSDGGVDAATADETEAGDDAMQVTLLTDPQILHVARTASIAEVEQGQVAVERATSADVLAFAELMIQDHATAVKQAETLAEEEQLAPADNDASQTLKEQSAQVVADLRQASDEEFDVVYMNAQLTSHQQSRDLFDNTLIPQASNAALESHLEAAHERFVLHLEQADAVIRELE